MNIINFRILGALLRCAPLPLLESWIRPCSTYYAMLHCSKKLSIILNKGPYHAQTLLIKWLMYYNLDFAMAD